MTVVLLKKQKSAIPSFGADPRWLQCLLHESRACCMSPMHCSELGTTQKNPLGFWASWRRNPPGGLIGQELIVDHQSITSASRRDNSFDFVLLSSHLVISRHQKHPTFTSLPVNGAFSSRIAARWSQVVRCLKPLMFDDRSLTFHTTHLSRISTYSSEHST